MTFVFSSCDYYDDESINVVYDAPNEDGIISYEAGISTKQNAARLNKLEYQIEKAENNQIIIKTNVEENETENLDSIEKETEQEKQENLLIKTNVVYVSKTGKKYHKLSNCNSATYFEISLSEAIAKGYTPCLRCAK